MPCSTIGPHAPSLSHQNLLSIFAYAAIYLPITPITVKFSRAMISFLHHKKHRRLVVHHLYTLQVSQHISNTNNMLPLLEILITRPNIGNRTRRNRFLDKHSNIRKRPREQNLDIPPRLNRSMKSRWRPNNSGMRRIKPIRLGQLLAHKSKVPWHDQDNPPKWRIPLYRDTPIARNSVS